MSMTPPSRSCLFGVGLGPGDPDLVTVRAAKVLACVPVVAYFAKKGAPGRARSIIARWIGSKCLELPLLYPVTTETPFCDPAYKEELRAFYLQAETAIAAHLVKGCDVAIACEGDPFFYGSFMHLFVRLKDRFRIEVIPGVTGMSGCWSAAKLPMAWGDDILSVIPATIEQALLLKHLQAADAAVVIKIGGNLPKVRAAISDAGRLGEAIYVEHGTGKAQAIIPLAQVNDANAPYFSSILIPGHGRRP